MTERRVPPHHHDRRYVKRTEASEHPHEQEDIEGLVALLESLQQQLDDHEQRLVDLEPKG